MLKQYFAKFTKHEKRNIAVFIPLMLLAFIFAGFAFFEALRMICNILGAIVCSSPWQAVDHLKRCGFMIILFFGSMYFATLMYRLFFYDEIRQQKIQKRGAITLICFGGVGLVYFIAGLVTGLYHPFEGYPTALFPIDMALLSLIYIGLGIFFLIDKKYVKDFSIAGLLEPKEIGIGSKIFRAICFIAGYFVACFSIYGVIMGGFIFDWRVYPIWGVLFILMMLEFLLTFGYETIVAPFIKKEHRGNFSFQISILAFLVSLVLVILNTISVVFYNNIACEVANGLLVISFTASFNAEYYIFTFGLMMPPILMFIRNFPKKWRTVNLD